jgi:hypothetical protein
MKTVTSSVIANFSIASTTNITLNIIIFTIIFLIFSTNFPTATTLTTIALYFSTFYHFAARVQ